MVAVAVAEEAVVAVAGGEADPAFAHFAADSGEDHMLVVQFYPKHGSGEDGVNAAFHFNTLFFHRLLAFAGLHVLDTCRRLDESSTKVPKEARGKPEPQLRAMKRINSGSVRRRIR